MLILTVDASVLHPSRFSPILGTILFIHGSFLSAFLGPALKIAVFGTENRPKNIPPEVAKKLSIKNEQKETQKRQKSGSKNGQGGAQNEGRKKEL